MASFDLPLLLIGTVLVGLMLLGGVAALLDREARARAWRQIALERRWDHERRRPQPPR